MKPLTCDICGSTDLVKQNGLFVCQSCGTKYSVEEARRMVMSETDGAVSAPPPVERNSSLDNLYIVARRAKSNNDNAQAAKYYDMICAMDPMSWEASYFSVHFKALTCTIAQISSSATTVANCLDSVMVLIEQAEKGGADPSEAAAEIADYALRAAEMFAQASSSAYFSTNWEYRHQYVLEYAERMTHACNIADQLAIAVLNHWKTVWASDIAIFACNKEIVLLEDFCKKAANPGGLQSCWTYNSACDTGAKLIANCQALIQKLEAEKTEYAKREEAARKSAQQKRNNAYWAAHQDDRRLLEDQATSLQAELDALADPISKLREKKRELEWDLSEPLPIELELQSEQARQDDLEAQLKRLGLFKGKEKKRIVDEISKQSAVIEKLRASAEQQRNDIAEKLRPQIESIEAQIEPLAAKERALDSQLSAIRGELSKDR